MSETWWLKYERAQEHFRDLTAEVARYVARHPYIAVRIPPPKKQPEVWRYKLQITEQPDPHIALVAGDVYHCLRTVLDHLEVAITGNRESYFPVHHKDPWETLPDGSLMPQRAKERASFESNTKGADHLALALIHELQPYAAGDRAATHPIGIVSKLDNADKHRKLLPLAAGITDGLSHVALRSEVIRTFSWRSRDDGAVVAQWTWTTSPEPPEAEVHVHLSGTPRIAVEVSEVEGHVELVEQLRWALAGFPELIEKLEPFAKKR